MKKVEIVEDPSTYTVIIIENEVETPEFLSPETVAELETQGDIMISNALQKYERDGFWKIIKEKK